MVVKILECVVLMALAIGLIINLYVMIVSIAGYKRHTKLKEERRNLEQERFAKERARLKKE